MKLKFLLLNTTLLSVPTIFISASCQNNKKETPSNNETLSLKNVSLNSKASILKQNLEKLDPSQQKDFIKNNFNLPQNLNINNLSLDLQNSVFSQKTILSFKDANNKEVKYEISNLINQNPQDIKNNKIIASLKGFGYYPSSIIKKINELPNNEAKIDFINTLITQEISFDSNSQYFINIDESEYNDEKTVLSGDVKLVITIDQLKDNKIITNKYDIQQVSKNNTYDPNRHEFEDQIEQQFWDGELIIQGIIKTDVIDNNSGQGYDIYEISKEVSKLQTMDEQIEYLKKYVNITFIKNDKYDYFTDESTHSHPGELHYVFGRRLKNNPDASIQRVSNVIKLKNFFDKYGDSHAGNWNHNTDRTVGSLTFRLNNGVNENGVAQPLLTSLGYSTTNSDFMDLARLTANQSNNDQYVMLNLLKKYIVIEGEIEPENYRYFFDMNRSHGHGTTNVHFYIQCTNLKTGEDTFVAFGVNGWGQKFEVKGLSFDQNAGTINSQEGRYLDLGHNITPYDLVHKLAQFNTFAEQLEELKKYVTVYGEPNYDEYEYKIDLKKTLENLYFKNTNYDFEFLANESTADDTNGTITLVFAQKDIKTNEIVKDTIILKGFKTANPNQYVDTFFDNQLSIRTILATNDTQPLITSSEFIKTLKTLTTFEQQLNYFHSVETDEFGFESSKYYFKVNKNLDLENYEYGIDLNKTTDFANDSLRKAQVVFWRMKKNEPNSKIEHAVTLTNFATLDNEENRIGAFNNYITTSEYPREFYEVTGSEYLTTLQKATSLKELANIIYEGYEWNSFFAPLNSASFTNNDNYATKMNTIKLYFEVKEKASNIIFKHTVDINQLGTFTKVGDYLFLTQGAKSSLLQASAHNIATTINNLSVDQGAKFNELIKLLKESANDARDLEYVNENNKYPEFKPFASGVTNIKESNKYIYKLLNIEAEEYSHTLQFEVEITNQENNSTEIKRVILPYFNN